MEFDLKQLPNDVNQLKTIIGQQQTIIHTIREQYEQLQRQVTLLIHRQYGQQTEQCIPGQGTLFAEGLPVPEPSIDDAQMAVRYTRKKGRAPRQFPEHIQRRRIEYDLTDEERICPCGCGVTLHKMGEDTLLQLELIPEQLYVIEHVKFKYAGCKQSPTVITATMPRQPIDQSIAGAGLLADMLIKKFDDHLPLYRQSEAWARQGIDLARSTLCDWVGQCAQLLGYLVDAMKPVLLASPKIHTDDTTIPVLDPTKNKTKTGRFWIYLGGAKGSPLCAIYDYTPTRSQTGPMAFLKNYSGYLQADAYTGYDVLYDPTRVDVDIIEAACMAHARRKFVEIAKTAKKTGSAHQALSFIQQLYRIEKVGHDLTDDERLALRQQKALPLLVTFKAWLDTRMNQVLPKSPLGHAIRYTLKNWDALTRYCEEGMLSIDNNAAERLMRVIAIGRKNYLFAGSDQGAKNAAICYSLIETCKLNNVNPYHYLRDVLKRLPTQLNKDIHALFPWNWQPSEPLNITI